jgi:hypothetical protein
MRDSQRYRDNAAECLLAAYEAAPTLLRQLNFSMAALWLAFARQDDAMDNLLATWDMAEPVKIDGLALSPPMAPPTTPPISNVA